MTLRRRALTQSPTGRPTHEEGLTQPESIRTILGRSQRCRLGPNSGLRPSAERQDPPEQGGMDPSPWDPILGLPSGFSWAGWLLSPPWLDRPMLRKEGLALFRGCPRRRSPTFSGMFSILASRRVLPAFPSASCEHPISRTCVCLRLTTTATLALGGQELRSFGERPGPEDTGAGHVPRGFVGPGETIPCGLPLLSSLPFPWVQGQEANEAPLASSYPSTPPEKEARFPLGSPPGSKGRTG